MAIVYMATNKVNGKRYVGMTSKTLEVRRARHQYRAFSAERQSSPRFYAAFRKYGIAVFDWEILAEYASDIGALSGEMEFIALLKPEYNVTAGGSGARKEAYNKIPTICLNDGRLSGT